jgi:2-iminoacetate synthase
LQIGYVPSFCTACYREGRVGDRFMELCKSGKIGDCCQPNALMTLQEYLLDYSNEKTRQFGENLIYNQLAQLPNDKIRSLVSEKLEKIKNGERDFRL